MNCQRCSSPLKPDDLFCSHCGLPLHQPPPGPIPPGYASMGYPPYGLPLGPPPNIPDYLVWSIITAIFCQPIGIAAIIFSVLTMSDRNNGRYASAAQNSKITRQLLNVGLVFLVLIALFYLATFLFYGLIFLVAILSGGGS